MSLDAISKIWRIAAHVQISKTHAEKHLLLILAPIDSLTRLDFYRLMNYILEVSPDVIDGEVIGRVLERVAPEDKENIMNNFTREFYDKGMAKGMAEGLAEGEAKALLRLLRRRFGDIPAHVEDRITGADASMLELWIDRVLDAAKPEDVFGSDLS